MKFFLDENFPKAAVTLLESRGHEVWDLRGTSREGVDDQAIFELAQTNAAIFLTTDRDFFHTIPHLYSAHHGVVVISLRQPNRERILSKLGWFLEKFEGDSLTGRIFQLRDESWRTIQPPE